MFSLNFLFLYLSLLVLFIHLLIFFIFSHSFLSFIKHQFFSDTRSRKNRKDQVQIQWGCHSVYFEENHYIQGVDCNSRRRVGGRERGQVSR